ncbi:thermonuclease family protein [Erythrobacter sp. NFXS35]|uniref:thermonuclease family protein n=1 Tax=Erythrobacter sp. NFXS35 TaxID=2818436 RepID=UPI0032DFF4B5
MGRIIPFRKAPVSRRTPPPTFRRGRSAAADKGVRWFPIALVALPLAAFSAVLLLPYGGGGPVAEGAVAGAVPAASATDREQARFGLCSGPVRVTCVVDGDTIWYRGTKIRIADLDTPEVSKPGCANEAALGRKATRRLQALLNAGPFTLEPNTFGPSEDRYGRSLQRVTRGGTSLGAVLVDEGLAEEWGGPRKAWC